MQFVDGNQPEPEWVKHLPPDIPICDIKAYLILKALAHFHGNRTAASKSLLISYRCLLDHINAYKEFGFTIPERIRGRPKIDS